MAKTSALKFGSHSSLLNNSSMSNNFSSSNFTFIEDSGTDQSIIDLNIFSIFTYTSIYFDVGGATSEMKTTIPLELVNNAYTPEILRDGTRVVFKINQAFCDTNPSQIKALLDTHQVCDLRASIDNCAKCHQHHDGTSSTQSIGTPEGTFQLHFDGKKHIFQTCKPSTEDLRKYPCIELTLSTLYEPSCHDHSLRLHIYKPMEIAH